MSRVYAWYQICAFVSTLWRSYEQSMVKVLALLALAGPLAVFFPMMGAIALNGGRAKGRGGRRRLLVCVHTNLVGPLPCTQSLEKRHPADESGYPPVSSEDEGAHKHQCTGAGKPLQLGPRRRSVSHDIRIQMKSAHHCRKRQVPPNHYQYLSAADSPCSPPPSHWSQLAC